ncbi:50S ribosomal protein L9 [Rickettsiales bacterium LUAb2]
MEVILREKINKRGNIGDIIKVKDGFAKNYLIPNNKAFYATEYYKNLLAAQKSQLDADNLAKLENAKTVAANFTNKAFIFIRSAGENGQLYGSVSTKDIVANLAKANLTLTPSQVKVKSAIKYIGSYEVALELHADIIIPIFAIVSRSNDEAEQMYKAHTDKLTKQAAKADENKSEEASAN